LTLSEKLKEYYASGGEDVSLSTLEFRHSSWDENIYIVRDWEDLEANLEGNGPLTTFRKYSFSIKGPEKDTQGRRYIEIAVDNVSREFITLIEKAVLEGNQTPITVIYREYLESDKTGPQNDPPLVLYLSDISVNMLKVTGRAEIASLINRRFPRVVYDERFRGLFN